MPPFISLGALDLSIGMVGAALSLKIREIGPMMNEKGYDGMNFGDCRLQVAFSATTCERKRIKYQKRAGFALYKVNDESHAICLETLPPELHF